MRNYVYMLECGDGSYYTGWTDDPDQRIKKHASGKGAKYTRSHLPVRLVHLEVFGTKEEAMQREYAIKQMERQEKDRLAQQPLFFGKIFYLIGKSASGKDTIYDRLLEKEELDLKPLVIYTTRPQRDGEQDGVEYHFTDQAGFETHFRQGKVVEHRTYQTVYGPWIYYTVDDEQIDLTRHHYLATGVLTSFMKMRRYFGKEQVVPVYIEVEDGLRLERAIGRERTQNPPKYEEMCRRFLADQKDFSEEKLQRAGIEKRFSNNTCVEDCLEEIIRTFFR